MWEILRNGESSVWTKYSKICCLEMKAKKIHNRKKQIDFDSKNN